MHGVGVQDIVTSGSAIAGKRGREDDAAAVEVLFGTRSYCCAYSSSTRRVSGTGLFCASPSSQHILQAWRNDGLQVARPYQAVPNTGRTRFAQQPGQHTDIRDPLYTWTPPPSNHFFRPSTLPTSSPSLGLSLSLYVSGDLAFSIWLFRIELVQPTSTLRPLFLPLLSSLHQALAPGCASCVHGRGGRAGGGA